MTETIRQTTTLTNEEGHALFAWGEDVFHASGDTVARQGGETTHFILEADGQPMSHLSIIRHTVTAGDAPVLIAGIGGVVTRGEAQGRGYARRLMQHAEEFYEREWRVQAGMLFCYDAMLPYYNSLGWQQLMGPVLIEQPQGRVQSTDNALVRPCTGFSWPEGTVVLNRQPW